MKINQYDSQKRMRSKQIKRLPAHSLHTTLSMPVISIFQCSAYISDKTSARGLMRHIDTGQMYDGRRIGVSLSQCNWCKSEMIRSTSRKWHRILLGIYIQVS